MTTQQTDWIEFDGSDPRIAEMENATSGWICRFEYGTESDVLKGHPFVNVSTQFLTHYWIIPDDPLREMKIRWAQTGQPVLVRMPNESYSFLVQVAGRDWKLIKMENGFVTVTTTTPDWNIPNAEYSFTPWED